MGLFDRFKKKKPEPSSGIVAPPRSAAINPGRRSSPYDTYQSILDQKVGIINPLVPFSFIESIEVLSIVNPDVSQMVSNVIQLGNTGHFVEVTTGDGTQARAAIDALHETAKRIYPLSAGVDGLVNALLGQCARGGALSLECVFGRDLSQGIQEVVLVPVKSIRWYRDKRMQLRPYQKVKDTMLTIPEDEYVALNPLTYIYYHLDAIEDNPYGIPPVSAALASVSLQMDMMKNLANVVRKVGLVGFISVLINAPTIKRGESDESYRQRLEQYIEEASSRITANYSDGVFVGFRGQHEISVQSLTADVRGLDSIMQINEEQIFSGVKSDPAMHGRTYSTTETYAGVVFDKLLASLEGYRRLVRRALERMYTLELRTKGVQVTDVNIIFKPSKPLNELQAHQAYTQKTLNADHDFRAGLLDWIGYARELGYDFPAIDDPEDTELFGKSAQEPEDSGEKDTKPEKNDEKQEKDGEKDKKKLDNAKNVCKDSYIGVLHGSEKVGVFHGRSKKLQQIREEINPNNPRQNGGAT